MINWHTKFEVSMITCNKDMKGNTPLGDLRVTHRVHLWLDGKHIVDFLLVIIELFSLALMAEALLSEICQNFLKGWVTSLSKFYADGDVARNTSMDHSTEE